MGYDAVIEEFSTISAKGQTTVPKVIRQALSLNEGDQIAFRIDDKGVTLRRADATREDPAIASFLAFLAKDIETSPQNVKALSPALAERIAALVEGVELDLDAPIEGDVDL
jgi:antitoxin PrlF